MFKELIQNRLVQLIILIFLLLIGLLIFEIIPFPGGVTLVDSFDDPLDNISAAINSVAPDSYSGQATPMRFTLKKDQNLLNTKNLANATDLDKDSFIFTMGEFTKADAIETDGTYLVYTGPQPKINLSAIVICEQTNAKLKESLSKLDPKYDTSLVTNGCTNDGIVCCIIIPTKTTN